jgi:hypothetical protein
MIFLKSNRGGPFCKKALPGPLPKNSHYLQSLPPVAMQQHDSSPGKHLSLGCQSIASCSLSRLHSRAF